MQKTLGGDRLGAGKKQKVNLHGYERSSHDMGYIWRSTMAPGTLVPFLKEVALPGDTFDINLGCEIMTHPTVGPLFGSYKVQLDIFQAPIRLYNSLLHNNALGIGMDMAKVKLPVISVDAFPIGSTVTDIDNSQINPSCILSYLGIRGVGVTDVKRERDFNAVPFLAYWDIYKNYYSNKQEEIGAVIHTPSETIVQTIDQVDLADNVGNPIGTVAQAPGEVNLTVTYGDIILVGYTGTTPVPSQIIFNTSQGEQPGTNMAVNWIDNGAGILQGTVSRNCIVINWRYKTANDIGDGTPKISLFTLSNIDDMRSAILAFNSVSAPFNVTGANLEPYSLVFQNGTDSPVKMNSQEGLGLKTYQSDLLQNWLQTEWIDGVNGISAVTAVDTTGGSFTIDQLNLSKKVYNMLNRIAVSGGTYDDWLDAVYDHDRYMRAESPMYMGGLIKELVFQEVVSNSASADQPLGTLAGRGTLAQKHKGGKIVIRVDEPSYIMGIISLTPRLDYSQGNKWDVNLQTLNDLHKPALDEIGFQESINEQRAWWSTNWNGTSSAWEQTSAGKVPAWLNYMTNVNETRGNFAVKENEMFMTLNRRYEADRTGGPITIADLTTYIDPSIYNFIFAETALDAQNFWAQIAIDMQVRRKMSAKVMPNL